MSNVTKTQDIIATFYSLGFQPEEIEEYVDAKPNTIRKHLANAKDRIGYHKAAEVAGWKLCEFLGFDYNEVRKEMLKAVMGKIGAIMLLCISIPSDLSMINQRRPNTGRSVVVTANRLSRKRVEEFPLLTA